MTKQGFTLIELLISIFIIAVALFALGALLNSTLRSTISAQKITIANVCAEQQLEEIIAQGYENISLDSGSCADTHFEWTADPVMVFEDLKQVVVQVKWSEGMVELKTLLSNK